MDARRASIASKKEPAPSHGEGVGGDERRRVCYPSSLMVAGACNHRYQTFSASRSTWS